MQKFAVIASLLATVLAVAAAQAQPQQAGVSAAVRGAVQLANAGSAANTVGRQIGSGERIFLGDRIRSGADSALQIVLLDETVFTIGADSDITIDEFVYNPGAGGNRLTASIGKGAFRFVTGKIAQARPEDMTVKTRAATIGVRGTIGYGVSGDTQDVIALGGPGLGNNANQRAGGLNILPNGAPGGGNVGSDLRRIDTAALVQIGQPIQFVPLTPELKAIINGALGTGPRGGQQQQQSAGGGGGGNTNAGTGGASDAAGQTTAQGGITSQEVAAVQTVLTQGTKAGGEGNEAAVRSNEFSGISGDISTYEQLRSVATGSAFFEQTNVALTGPGSSGSYGWHASIDFSSRSIHTHFFSINVTGAVNMSGGDIGRNTNFNSLAGPAVETINSGNANFVFNCPASTCTGVTTFLNSGGVVAAQALHALTITQGGSSVSGGGLAGRCNNCD